MSAIFQTYDGWKCYTPEQHTPFVDECILLRECLPCPFHGTCCEAVGFDYKDASCRVHYDCGASGPYADDEESAVKHNNTRTPHDALHRDAHHA